MSAITRSMSRRMTWPLTGALGNDPGQGRAVALSAANAFYIRPTAQGAQDGSSWNNAIALSRAGDALAVLNAGGTIYVAAWDGDYSVTSPITINRQSGSGAATILGAAEDLSPLKATLNSTRIAWVAGENYSRTDPLNGGDVFLLAEGTAGVTFSHFSFTNIGSGVGIFCNASDITIADCDATNSYIMVNLARDPTGASIVADTYTVSNLTLERLTSTGYELGLFNSQATMSGFTATDITGDSEYNYGSAFTEGFHLAGTVVAPVMTNVVCDRSAYNNRGAVYWNGDGICCEGGVSGATWNNCGGSFNDDGGIDTKEESGTWNGCEVVGNKMNFKCWATLGGTINDIISTNPVKNGGTDNPQHFQFAGTGDAVWDLNRPVITNDLGNTSTIFRCEKSAGSVTVNVDDWAGLISVDPDTVVSSTTGQTITVNFTNPVLPTVSAATVTWKTGHEAGVIDEATSVGTAIADLSATTANLTGTMLYRIKNDADGKFTIVGSELRLAAALVASTKTKHTCTVQAYDPSGLAQSSASVTIYVNATTLDADTAAFDTALGSAGLTQLATGGRRWRSAYDNFFRGLKSGLGATDYGQFDFFMAPTSYDVAVAKRNLKQDLYHMTWNGSPSWSAKGFWMGDGVDNDISFSFNPATAVSPKFVQNSAHLLVHKIGSNVGETIPDLGQDTASYRTFLIVRRADNLVQTGLNSSSTNTSANTDSRKWCGINRIVSGSYKWMLDTAVNTKSDTSVAIQNAAMKAGVGTWLGSGRVSGGYDWISFGGGFAAEGAAFAAIKIPHTQFLEQAAIAE